MFGSGGFMLGAMRKAAVIAAMSGMAAGIFAPNARAQADAQTSAPSQPPAAAPSGPAPIRLSVDATQAPQKILHAHMQIPVQQGPLTLLYAKWIPGEHRPDGPINNVGGLKFSGAGKTIAWRRDLTEMFALHLDVPQGVSSL